MRCYRNKTKSGAEIMKEKQIQEVMALVDRYVEQRLEAMRKAETRHDNTLVVTYSLETRNAIESALREQVRVGPEGWKLVPVEPTDAMVQAAHHLDLSYMPGQEGADRAAIYRAMLSAAPMQPAHVPGDK